MGELKAKLKAGASSFQSKVDKLEADLQTRKKLISNLEAKLQKIKASSAANEKALAASKKHASELQVKLNRSVGEDDLSAARAQLDASKRLSDDLESRLGERDSQLQHLKVQFEGVQSQLKRQMELSRSPSGSSSQKEEALSKLVEELTQRLKKSPNPRLLQVLQGKLADLQQRNDQYLRRIDTLEASGRAAPATDPQILRSLVESRSKAERELAAARQAVADSTAQLDALRNALAHAKDSSLAAQQELSLIHI